MPKRLDKDQFYALMASSDDAQLRKSIWNLYWRGSAAMRQRIEAELGPKTAVHRSKSEKEAVDPQWLLDEVTDFAELARSGAYIAGNRRVSPRERTRWRFRFQRLVADAERALGSADPEDLADAVAVMELLVDLACEMRSYDYFRSEDPIEAARFVVSDAVALMWSRIRDTWGFSDFAARGAPQLIAWESPHGWTRIGDGRVAQKETSLATVLASMLTAPDMWIGFAASYLRCLDEIERARHSAPKRKSQSAAQAGRQLAYSLAEWNQLLHDKLEGSEAEDLLQKLDRHPALGY